MSMALSIILLKITKTKLDSLSFLIEIVLEVNSTPKCKNLEKMGRAVRPKKGKNNFECLPCLRYNGGLATVCHDEFQQ